ncbi:AraC family transcriptional regulator [Rhodococcus pyridinivorans]|uniref:AraC family transcriptional regulator n=1 Tax=Rhodococcus pyridinivorans TaxID=103816 RepID=UPI002225C060|nr:AraC family transcriptional regulator [Rhodococcus pyridinivorans]MCW3472701.1 AraC family transcriptional regulator [Rhodococcus pyridinivorans]
MTEIRPGNPAPHSICDTPDRLAKAMSTFVPMSVIDMKVTPQHERSHLVPIDDIVFVDFSWGPLELSRRPGILGDTSEEYLALAAIHSGSEVVSIGNDQHVLSEGDVVLWNCQAPTRIHVPHSLHKSALLVPTRVLRHLSLSSDSRKPFEYFTEAPTAPLMRLLLSYMGTSPDPVSPAYRRMRNALVEMFLGTVETHSNAATSSLLPGLRAAVCSWIDQHLDDPDLDPAKAAAAHSVSVRTLHRAFQTHTETFAEVVQIRKLERASAMLTDPALTVAAISARLNFANPSHFSRVFARHFGRSPRDYRCELLGSGAGAASA